MILLLRNWDFRIFEWFNSLAARAVWGDWMIVFLAKYFLYVLIVAGVVFLLALFLPRFKELRNRNPAPEASLRYGAGLKFLFYVVFSGLVARFMVAELIRFLYNRPRPFNITSEVLARLGVGQIHQLVPHVNGFSFPSGHASFTFAVATAISFYYPRWSILFFAAAFLISIGRVAAGLHWPSDIVGGAIVGIGTAYLIRAVFRKYLKNTF